MHSLFRIKLDPIVCKISLCYQYFNIVIFSKIFDKNSHISG